MHFRSSTYESPQRRRDEARRIYDAFLSVDAPDQVRADATFVFRGAVACSISQP